MKPVTVICLLLLLSCRTSSYAQGENNMWCFGKHGGLDFNAGPPVFFYDSISPGNEGCASVCNMNGNLLFYSSPTAVWDRNNNVMPNGSGLLGGYSSTQGVAIAQSFSNADQYYLFTLDYMGATPGYLRYSVVDMTLNNGYGDIIAGQKNIIIDSNVYEKMTLVRAGDCISDWLLVHERSNHIFHAFRINASGINLAPVISSSGAYNDINYYAQGEMKVSPDGQNIALVTGLNATIEMYSFDNNTGIVSNAIQLDTLQNNYLYGLSYSPDGSKLYTTAYSGTSCVSQYDLSLLPNVTAVKNSRITVALVTVNGGMRIGPDDKVYFITDGEIGVIQNPNLVCPACNVAYNNVVAIPLTAADVGLQLGNPYLQNSVAVFTTNSHDTTACVALDTISISGPPNYTSYIWSDGTTGQSDTFTQPGTKWVTASIGCTIRVDTFHVSGLLVNSSTQATDTAICFANSTPVLTAPGTYITYLWSDGIAQQSDTIGAPGTKWVRATDPNSCSLLVDTFHVHDLRDTIKRTTDTTGCVSFWPAVISAPQVILPTCGVMV